MNKRLGEIAGLQESKIDFKKNIITISSALKRTKTNNIYDHGPTKNKSIRYFPMNAKVRKIFKSRVSYSSDALIFEDQGGGAINISHFCTKVFKPLQKAYGMKKIIRFHDLRHTYASHYMMNGGEIFTLKELLGHRDLKSTMVYAHLSPRFMQKSADVVVF